MKKQTIEEQTSRIKGIMGINENQNFRDSDDKVFIKLAKNAINSLTSMGDETYQEPDEFGYMLGAMKVAMSDKYHFTPEMMANALYEILGGHKEKMDEPDSDMEFARANYEKFGGLNESDSSNSIKVLWEKISEMSKDYSDALRNLDDVGCDDSETYAEYYHSSGQMEPGDHDDYDNDYHDNGYSHSQQTSADRLDYANSAEDPITRAERRMGA